MLFVRCCAENYLSSESKEIRLEAVRTCCKLLSPAIQVWIIGVISNKFYYLMKHQSKISFMKERSFLI